MSTPIVKSLIDEQLAALKQIWTTEQAEYHGEHVDFDPIYLWPKPVQQPHPPIYLGGESKAAPASSVEQQRADQFGR